MGEREREMEISSRRNTTERIQILRERKQARHLLFGGKDRYRGAALEKTYTVMADSFSV